MGPISYTQAALFAGCPARYKAERIDGMRQPPSLPMRQGSFIHSVIEKYTMRLMESGEISRKGLAADIASSMWDASGLPNIVRDETMWLCENVARDLVIHRNNVVGVELKIAVDETGAFVAYDSPLAAVRGRIDRLEIQGETMLVWDLKSGRLIDSAKESKQLQLYLAMARALAPMSGNFVGKFYYPRHEAERVAEFGSADLNAALAWAFRIRGAILEAEASGNWKATPGASCADCPIFHSCAERRRLADSMARPVVTEQDAAEALTRVGVLERELLEIREALKLFVEANGPVEVGGLVADIVARQIQEWPVGDLEGVLSRHGLDPQKFLRGDTRKIRRAIMRYPGLGTDLSAIAIDKTHTRLDIRRVGTEKQITAEEPS